MSTDNLLYGKNPLQRIVGLEVDNESVEIFTQNQDGSISSVFNTHRYWILCNTNADGTFVKLDGDLHYKWGKQFSNGRDYFNAKTLLKKNGNDIYSISNPEEACMVKDGYTFYKGITQKEVSLLSFDIETTGLDGNANDAMVLLISTTFRNHLGESVNKLFAYDEYETEGEMLDAFFNYVLESNPSLIVGHNIVTFDFPYLKGRADANSVPFRLGRDGSNVKFNNYESKFRLDGTRDLMYKGVKIYGREIVDTYFLSVSFDVSKSIESYALKPMIKQLGMEKEGRQYYDAGLIKNHYKDKKEWEKIKQYCVDDAEDPIKLWDHMGPLYFNMCPMIPKPLSEMLLSASGSKINGMMVRAYLQKQHSIPKASETRKYQGALSWGKPGIYKNVFKADCQSMYPSIIINDSVYSDDKDPNAYLLELVKIFRKNRMEYKKLAAETGDNYWKQMDTTAKSILNSFYGFFGCGGLNFNDFDAADHITRRGREILSTAIKWATSKEFKDLAPEYFETHEGME